MSDSLSKDYLPTVQRSGFAGRLILFLSNVPAVLCTLPFIYMLPFLKRILLVGTVCWLLTANQAVNADITRAFLGAKLIDGNDTNPVENAVLIVRNGKIVAAGSMKEVEVPEAAERIELNGKILIPGIINTHGHVNAVRGLESGHYNKDNLLRQLSLYARYGVTTINSLGGDGKEAVQLRTLQDKQLDRARLLLAGTIVTGKTIDEARAIIEQNRKLAVDFIKIRVDDNLGRTEKMKPDLYTAIIEHAHERGLRVASHLYYLEDAKRLLRAGTDFIAHSVRDKSVDKELVELLKEKNVCYCPTLTREMSTFIYESVPDFFEDPFFLKEADQSVLDQLKAPERMKKIKQSLTAQQYKQALKQAKINLKTVADSGATIAFGTDTGPPGRFQGYFEHMELAMMAEAGLTPRQILRSATSDAARCLGLNELGTLETGKWADFIVLNKDPLVDIKNLRSIESVWIAGNRVPDKN